MLDFLYNNITPFLKVAPVVGYLEDLLVQQIIIHIILLVQVLSLILLFIFFILNLIFFINQERIISRFDNKYIKFYIKYQSFLAKLSLIYVPIIIIIGLFTLAHGFYFLITHQIPYYCLDIDLHTYISTSNSEAINECTSKISTSGLFFLFNLFFNLKKSAGKKDKIGNKSI